VARAVVRATGVAAFGLAAAGALAAQESGAPPAADPAAPPPVNAVWVPQSYSFAYFGLTSLYSCEGLRDVARHVLLRAGARPDDLKVRVTCVETGGTAVERMPQVRIDAAFPAVATPELLERLRNDPKRELTARVRGESDPAEDALRQFPAQRQVVVIDGRSDRRIDDGDCELLQHLVRHVLTPAGVPEAAGSRLNCVPRTATIGSVNLRLDTLQKVPEPDAPPVPGT
jgi:CheY-like chemotaxis protein